MPMEIQSTSRVGGGPEGRETEAEGETCLAVATDCAATQIADFCTCSTTSRRDEKLVGADEA